MLGGTDGLNEVLVRSIARKFRFDIGSLIFMEIRTEE
jgi:hypothetical protein